MVNKANKDDPKAYSYTSVRVNGINLYYVDENKTSNKVLLLCHGWPDLWIAWREQIYYLAELGYRVIVPCLRGFGDSQGPEAVDQYRIKMVSKDLVGLLDHLEIPKVTLVGHDWGGNIVWRFVLFYPERVLAIASFCTPDIPPSPTYVSLEQLVQMFPNFSYQLYLVQPAAEKELDTKGNARLFYNRLFRPLAELAGPLYDTTTNSLVNGRPPLQKSEAIPQSVMDYYVEKLEKYGSRGGLNWYKQTKINYEESKDQNPLIDLPALMVSARGDRALPPEMTAGMEKNVPKVEKHIVENSGHWILWEKPDECNTILANWLKQSVYPN